MLISEYQTAGYRVSNSVSQKEMERMEALAMSAYILPILETATLQDDDVKAAVMALAFFGMLKNNVAVTRSGAKEKVVENSTAGSVAKISQVNAYDCHEKLEVLRKKEGAKATAEVFDIFEIYFKTNFISL